MRVVGGSAAARDVPRSDPDTWAAPPAAAALILAARGFPPVGQLELSPCDNSTQPALLEQGRSPRYSRSIIRPGTTHTLADQGFSHWNGSAPAALPAPAGSMIFSLTEAPRHGGSEFREPWMVSLIPLPIGLSSDFVRCARLRPTTPSPQAEQLHGRVHSSDPGFILRASVPP